MKSTFTFTSIHLPQQKAANSGILGSLLLLAAGTSFMVAAYVARCPLFGLCPPPPPLLDTVAIQHYSATIPVWRYLYSATKLPQAITDGWKAEGVAFLAFGQQQAGTVPVYRHVAPDPWRYQLSTKAALGNGWINEGVAFYAYAQPQTQGADSQVSTRSIYQYYAKDAAGGWRYFYSPDPSVGNGWTNEGPAFHALVVAEDAS